MKIKLSDHFSYARLLRFVLPSIVMVLITSVYSIVDGFFVSNILGKTAFAAVNLIMPGVYAIGALGFMIGTGGTALVSMTLGEGNKKQANAYFSMLILLLVAAGVIFSILTFLFMPQIATFLGANAAMLTDCVLYGRVLTASSVFFLLQAAFQSFLVAAEKPVFGLVISIASGITNVVLDFLFIYVFQGGILGAALATGLGQLIGGVIPLVYFLRDNDSLLRLIPTKMEWRAIGKACANGSSEMLTNLSFSIVGILYNLQLMRLLGENGVAAYGVILYVSFVFMAIFFGYSMGIAPIIGYNHGANNAAELHNVFLKSLWLIGIASALMTGLGILLARPLAHIFVGYDAALCALTVTAMQIYSLSFLLSGLNIFGSALFTALNNGVLSALISFLRTLVLQVASILLLPLWFGSTGLWSAVLVAEGVTMVLTVFLIVRNRKRYRYA